VALIAGSGLLATGHGRDAAAVAEAKMNLGFEQSRSRSGWPICAAIDAAARHGGRPLPSAHRDLLRTARVRAVMDSCPRSSSYPPALNAGPGSGREIPFARPFGA
jgi:hypothetical protein